MDQSESKADSGGNRSQNGGASPQNLLKPKRRSMVERELETSLTARVTSPVSSGEVKGTTSRYGRTRRLKTDTEFCESDKATTTMLKSPIDEQTPSKSPAYKMNASNSLTKRDSPKTPIMETTSNVEHQVENIISNNATLSRFSTEKNKGKSPAKFNKIYIRKDLIQSKEKEETVSIMKNMFSPSKSSRKPSTNTHLSNILERSSEKYNLNISETKPKLGYKDTSSVVKTLDFDMGKKKKKPEESTANIISKSELFEMEAKAEYQVGDLAWSRVGTYPFWPCIITRDPFSGVFVKKKLFGRVERGIFHVTFFGDNGRRGWIVDNMLRRYQGLEEFEATRDGFTPQSKKKDPRLYSAFFVSDKKRHSWNVSVQEAETLMREPKRMRIDALNDLLSTTRVMKTTPKRQRSEKIVRTDSDVSLSESLYDTLFSEDDTKDELDNSKNKPRKKSLDVSDVVTACLDNMAAKTGISKIQKQSHMDRWLQKAKSKTPEKIQNVFGPSKGRNEMKGTNSGKRNRKTPLKDQKTLIPKNSGGSNEDDTLGVLRISTCFQLSDHDYNKLDTENANPENNQNRNTQDNNIIKTNSVVTDKSCGIGIISNIKTLCDRSMSEDKPKEIFDIENNMSVAGEELIVTETDETTVKTDARSLNDQTNEVSKPFGSDTQDTDAQEKKSGNMQTSMDVDVQDISNKDQDNMDVDTPESVEDNTPKDLNAGGPQTPEKTMPSNNESLPNRESPSYRVTRRSKRLSLDPKSKITSSEVTDSKIKGDLIGFSSEYKTNEKNKIMNSLKSFQKSPSKKKRKVTKFCDKPSENEIKKITKGKSCKYDVEIQIDSTSTNSDCITNGVHDNLPASNCQTKKSDTLDKDTNLTSNDSKPVGESVNNVSFTKIANITLSSDVSKILEDFSEMYDDSQLGEVGVTLPKLISLNSNISHDHIEKITTKDQVTENSDQIGTSTIEENKFSNIPSNVNETNGEEVSDANGDVNRDEESTELIADTTQTIVVEKSPKFIEKITTNDQVTENSDQIETGTIEENKLSNIPTNINESNGEEVSDANGDGNHDEESTEFIADTTQTIVVEKSPKFIEKITTKDQVTENSDQIETGTIEENKFSNIPSNINESNGEEVSDANGDVNHDKESTELIADTTQTIVVEKSRKFIEKITIKDQVTENSDQIETGTIEENKFSNIPSNVNESNGEEVSDANGDVNHDEKSTELIADTTQTIVVENSPKLVACNGYLETDTESLDDKATKCADNKLEEGVEFEQHNSNESLEMELTPLEEIYAAQLKAVKENNRQSKSNQQLEKECVLSHLNALIHDAMDIDEVNCEVEKPLETKDVQSLNKEYSEPMEENDDALGSAIESDETIPKALDEVEDSSEPESPTYEKKSVVKESINIKIASESDSIEQTNDKNNSEICRDKAASVLNKLKTYSYDDKLVTLKEFEVKVARMPMETFQKNLLSLKEKETFRENPVELTVKEPLQENLAERPEKTEPQKDFENTSEKEPLPKNLEEPAEKVLLPNNLNPSEKEPLAKNLEEPAEKVLSQNNLNPSEKEALPKNFEEPAEKVPLQNNVDEPIEKEMLRNNLEEASKRETLQKNFEEDTKLDENIGTVKDIPENNGEPSEKETIQNNMEENTQLADKSDQKSDTVEEAVIKSECGSDSDFEDNVSIAAICRSYSEESKGSKSAQRSTKECAKPKRKPSKDKNTTQPKMEMHQALENPEFLKYIELRQDALIDENPHVTEDEIVEYLFKTWVYSENLKSETVKSFDKEQSTLVKGLGDEPPPQPKKIRKKIKVEKEKEKESQSTEEIAPKDRSKRKVAPAYYNENDTDLEEELDVFEIFKMVNKEPIKPKVENDESSNTDANLKTVEEEKEQPEPDNYVVDEVETFFSQLAKPKPNVFKGIPRERICEICEKPGSLIKCKGLCGGMFHSDCVRREIEAPPKTDGANRTRKKKKPRGRKPKNLDDSGSQSDDKKDLNLSDETIADEIKLDNNLVIDADNFESQLEAKMQEMLKSELPEDYDYSSEEELQWNDTATGKCEIVDVKLKLKRPENEQGEFKCNGCLKNEIPVCFVCKSTKSPKNSVELRQKCQTAHCHKYYHLECLDIWPQTQFSGGEPSRNNKKVSDSFEAMTCPRHVCHTCVCDDPRGCNTRFSGDKLARCVRCPATYHSFNKCLPAGSTILSASHIICPRHYEHRPGKIPCHVNTGWCFICALGGTLICCEYCPTSFHAECLNIKPPEGNYMCEDCETGRLPLYGEMMWVKLGHYRWWPGIILHPCEIPANIMAVRHSSGEFVVRFFGQYDHYWVNRGRVFPFLEGDSGKLSGQKSKIDEAFTMAMEHAQRACEILKNAAPNEEENTDIASSLLPPHYVKLKVNKPCGALINYKLDDEENSLTLCECDPNDIEPCGPDTHCLNRILLTECGPTCRAGDRCRNRAFEMRLYPKLAPHRTRWGGWGLKTLEPIRQGQFVIEYVGELLDEAEFRRRMQRKHETRDENYYFLTLDRDRMIDAGPKGNLARFMNHCCEPNCETQKWTVLGDVRVGLFALMDIPANSEVTFNYNLECAGIEKKPCLCGAKRCSGYIGAKPKQEEAQPKKSKRPYKKRKPIVENSPSTSKTKVVKPRMTQRSRPKEVKELTEIEKDLLIIKNATNGLSSDSEASGRLSSVDTEKLVKDDLKPLKRKRVSFSKDEAVVCNGDVDLSPSAKKVKLETLSGVGD